MSKYSLCSTNANNTGQQECDVAKGIVQKLFIDNGKVAAADYADAATFFAKLVSNSKLSKTDTNKIFPLPEIQDIVDSSDANKEGSLNQGFKTVLLEGKPGYKVKFFGGSSLLKRLKAGYDNQVVKLRELDANGYFWGTKSGTDSVGYSAKLFFTGGKAATGQAVEEGVIECSISFLSAVEYFKNSYYVKNPGNANDIAALLDVEMYAISHVTNVWKIGLRINGTDLIGAYQVPAAVRALIAGLTFTAGTGANYGTALAITSVADDITLGALTVTFDSTAYTALTGGTIIKLNPPTPAVLIAADVTDTEMLSVLLTK
jgi:hypothetical protein